MNIYSKIALVSLSAGVVLAGAFAISAVRSPDAVSPRHHAPQSTRTYMADGASETDKSEEYYLALEGKMLYAYRIHDGQKELIRCENAQPMLMSEDEVRNLERGIYAESFEDLCLYFESYLS